MTGKMQWRKEGAIFFRALREDRRRAQGVREVGSVTRGCGLKGGDKEKFVNTRVSRESQGRAKEKKVQERKTTRGGGKEMLESKGKKRID